MDPLAMLMVKAIITGMVLVGFLGFVFWRFAAKSTERELGRLDRETEMVRKKQSELNSKIKEVNEELVKRRGEADALVAKMREDAEEAARLERDKIVKKAREEGEEIISKAQRTKDDMRKALELEMHMKAVDFTMLLVTEIFSERLRASVDRDLTMEFLEGLEKVDMGVIDEAIGEAEVVSAAPLAADMAAKLASILESKLGRQISIMSKIDPSILVGIMIRFGSLRLDGTLVNILKQKTIEYKERLERGLLKTDKVPGTSDATTDAGESSSAASA